MEPLPVRLCSFKTPLTLWLPLFCPPTLISDEPRIAVLWLLLPLPLWFPLKQPTPQPAAKAALLKPNTRADAAVIAIRVFLTDFILFPVEVSVSHRCVTR